MRSLTSQGDEKMNARVRKHLLRQLAKRTPEQIAADIEDLKRMTRELRKSVEKSRKINATKKGGAA